MEHNPILIVDDDQDDLDLIKDVVEHLKISRPVRFFKSGDELQAYLEAHSVAQFLILCDVNLPNQDGFAVKKNISENEVLKYKSVPFIYWSTSASQKQIQFAYDLPAQGFFFKPNNFDDLCSTFKTIVEYWQKSQHPKRVE
jgi:CheY-like chemotaxis protein